MLRTGVCIGVLCLFGIQFHAFSQELNGGWFVGVRYMLPFSSPPKVIRSADGYGVTLGYARIPEDERSFQWQAFAGVDLFNYEPTTSGVTEITTGSTVLSVGFTPEYRILPTDGWELYLACQLKFGHHIGNSNVLYYVDGEAKTESQHPSAGWGVGFSPMLKLQAPVEGNLNASVFIGWDSTDFGKGMRALRSDFYEPYTHKASVIYAGISVVLLNKKER